MPPSAFSDPVPLCAAQLLALVAVAARELVWGRRLVAREIRCWLERTASIVDPAIRADALDALTRKRGATDGAALCWALLSRRDPRLLRLLVVHELIWDFLDSVSERGAGAGEANGRQLHLAILESLVPDRPVSDYYRYHPWKDDGGYLVALVETCRSYCRSLPSYPLVRPTLVREANRALVQGLNHASDPAEREAALRGWAQAEFPGESAIRWFELTGASSAPLTIHVLLALAAEGQAASADVDAAYAAYFPWVSLTTVMLDSYVDQREDAASGNHSYIAHYASQEEAFRRLEESIRRSAHGVLQLRGGHRHAVVVACMIAMYLSKDSARAPELRATTRRLARSGGSLTRLLLPILRLWRICCAQQSA
jgi:tetraprenyl-beta-curcumene synthase